MHNRRELLTCIIVASNWQHLRGCAMKSKLKKHCTVVSNASTSSPLSASYHVCEIKQISAKCIFIQYKNTHFRISCEICVVD